MEDLQVHWWPMENRSRIPEIAARFPSARSTRSLRQQKSQSVDGSLRS
jgi:hypothetical protein